MLSRRQLFAGFAALAVLPRTARADIVCQPWAGGEFCEAGIKFAPDARTAEQQCQFWCWAACIETIFAISGHHVPQSDIVARVYGNPVCTVADGTTIASAVSGDWRDAKRRSFSAACDILIDVQSGAWRPDAHIIAARELEAGRPLILGALGHAVLLTAMTFQRDAYGNIAVDQMTIRDPWPTNPNRRVLMPHEVHDISFLAQVRVG